MSWELLKQLQLNLVIPYRFEEDQLFKFEKNYVEIEELVVFNMANEDGI